METRSRTAWWLLAVAIIFAGLFITRSIWLESMGKYLVDVQPPVRSDMVVVLGGDWYGNRILAAAKVAQDGFAPAVLVSGGGNMYGMHESDFAIPFAVRHGYSEKMFLHLDYPANSTADEALAVVAELRRRHVKKYILVTSEFHTRRAGKIFRTVAPDLELRVVACPDTLHWSNWWFEREGRKAFFMEWLKTVTSKVGV